MNNRTPSQTTNPRKQMTQSARDHALQQKLREARELEEQKDRALRATRPTS
ncbi:MAG: hypothetical protein ACK4XJ_09795 [Fimbriimonadaceae bacterium]